MRTRARFAAAVLAATLLASPLTGCGTSKDDYAEAEKQWDAAIEALDPMFTEVAASMEGDIATFDGDKTAESVEAAAAEARDSVEQAKLFVAEFDESAAKSRYVQSLDDALAALEKMDAWAEEVRGFGGILEAVDAIGTLADTGNTALNAAGSANTANDWAKMKAQGQAAQKAFSSAVTMCGAEHQKDATLGFDKFSAILAKKKAMADQLVAAADAAKANRISVYNAAIDKFNALNGQLDSMQQPAFVDDPSILMKGLFTQFGAAEALFEKADDAHGKAYEEIEAGNY